MTAIVSPVASATSSVPVSACGPRDMIVPAPISTSANVPRSSTNARRHRSASGGSGPRKSERAIGEAGDYMDWRTAPNGNCATPQIRVKVDHPPLAARGTGVGVIDEKYRLRGVGLAVLAAGLIGSALVVPAGTADSAPDRAFAAAI